MLFYFFWRLSVNNNWEFFCTIFILPANSRSILDVLWHIEMYCFEIRQSWKRVLKVFEDADSFPHISSRPKSIKPGCLKLQHSSTKDLWAVNRGWHHWRRLIMYTMIRGGNSILELCSKVRRHLVWLQFIALTKLWVHNHISTHPHNKEITAFST